MSVAVALAEPAGQVRLRFREDDEGDAGEDAPIAANLSAATVAGGALWVANDETARVERLLRTDPDGFGRHRPFALGDHVDLPDDGEMDIEGLSADDGYLWVVGSHSARRLKPAPGERDPKAVLERLSTLRWDPNRWFLGRVPLAPDPTDGSDAPALSRETRAPDGRALRAACLPIKRKKGTALVRALAGDEHLAPFLGLPSKENGLDVEGLAVRGERVFLGLRGPVLRGWAVALELRLREGAAAYELELATTTDGSAYRKRFLDLDGLGIRELCWHGRDLLVLAGPTMDLDGPVRIHRWRNPLGAEAPVVLPRDDLPLVAELGYGRGLDHAEGLTILDEGVEGERLLVVHDAPAPARLLDGGRGLLLDAYRLSPAASDGGEPAAAAEEGPIRFGGEP